MDQQVLFDEKVTMNKVEEYRSQLDDDLTEDTSGTLAAMVEEVEKVSKLLVQTQSKLLGAHNEINASHDKAEALEQTLHEREEELKSLRNENCLLLDEGQKLRDNEKNFRDQIRSLEQAITDRDAGRTRPELEQRLRKAVELLKKDLGTSNDKNSSNR